MKGKILKALKQEYKNLGVSEGAFDGVASLLEQTIKEESGIDEGVKGEAVSVLLKTIQGDVDRERGEKNRLRSELEKLKKEPANEPTEPKEDDETKALLIEMQRQISKLAGERTHETTSSKITALLREKKVPDSFIDLALSGRTFSDGFDVDAFVTQVSDGYAKVQGELADERFKGGKKPEEGGGGADSLDSIVKAIEDGTKEILTKK